MLCFSWLLKEHFGMEKFSFSLPTGRRNVFSILKLDAPELWLGVFCCVTKMIDLDELVFIIGCFLLNLLFVENCRIERCIQEVKFRSRSQCQFMDCGEFKKFKILWRISSLQELGKSTTNGFQSLVDQSCSNSKVICICIITEGKIILSYLNRRRFS